MAGQQAIGCARIIGLPSHSFHPVIPEERSNGLFYPYSAQDKGKNPMDSTTLSKGTNPFPPNQLPTPTNPCTPAPT